MKVVLAPAGHTLSHLGRALAIREGLVARGHEVVLAASASRSGFLTRLGVPHELLPDLSEADGSAILGPTWFRPARFEAAVRAEAALLARVRPDRALGIFRFTGRVSARLAGVPYDGVSCGCITPACEEALGFAPGEPGEAEQVGALRLFRHGLAVRLSPLLSRLGVEPIDDLWELLLGERTFLWDVPEFQPLRPAPGLVHVGPIDWTGWPAAPGVLSRFEALPAPRAVVSFGTSPGHERAALRIAEMLGRLGFSVAVACGGQGAAALAGRGFTAFDFLPLDQALRSAAVLACHGGQGVVLEAIRRRVPILALPFQPEQAQNGRCLERLGVGLRLAHGEVYLPGAEPAEESFLKMPAAGVEQRVAAFLADPDGPRRRDRAAEAVQRAGGVAALVAALEAAP
jgi:UDP:flavonoid glycosyltransferase YjiC (YdhE family)